jgi:hypothetical protein
MAERQKGMRERMLAEPVVRDLPAGVVAVGSPARVVRAL